MSATVLQTIANRVFDNEQPQEATMDVRASVMGGRVSAKLACPECREDREDYLDTCDETSVTECFTCGEVYVADLDD